MGVTHPKMLDPGPHVWPQLSSTPLACRVTEDSLQSLGLGLLL